MEPEHAFLGHILVPQGKPNESACPRKRVVIPRLCGLRRCLGGLFTPVIPEGWAANGSAFWTIYKGSEVNPMRSILPVVTLLSLAIGGCCTKLPSTAEDQEWGSDLHWCGIFSGYGTSEQPDRSKAMYTPVNAREYAQLLCENVDIEDYASCMNRINDFHHQSKGRASGEGSSTSGPFAMQIGGEVYVGSYWGTPFESVFRVTDDRGQACRGSYSAFFGSTEAVFQVVCDDGQRGKADIVSDRDGRNGIGYVAMDDGREGRIVYGPDVAMAARQSL